MAIVLFYVTGLLLISSLVDLNTYQNTGKVMELNIVGNAINAAAPKDLRGTKREGIEVPVNMIWSFKRAAGAAKQDSYLKIGFGTSVTNRMITGAVKTWSFNGTDEKAKGKGLDVVYLDTISITPSYGGPVKVYQLRVSADVSHLVQFLKNYQFAGTDADAAVIIGAFGISAMVMHGPVENAPEAGVELAIQKDRKRYQALIQIYSTQQVVTFLKDNNSARVKALRDSFTRQVEGRKNKADQAKAAKKDIDLNIFIYLSKKIHEATITDANGVTITHGARGCGTGRTRESIASKFAAVLEEIQNGNRKRILNISSYVPGKYTATKGTQPKTAKTQMVPVPISYKGAYYADVLWTKTAESVAEAIRDIAPDDNSAARISQIVTEVEGAITKRQGRTAAGKKDKRGAAIDITEVLKAHNAPTVGGGGVGLEKLTLQLPGADQVVTGGGGLKGAGTPPQGGFGGGLAFELPEL